MVTKNVAVKPVAFPEAPKRDDMQNFEQLFQPAQPTALERYLQRLENRKPPGERRKVFVYCDIHVRPIPTDDRTRFFVPDLTVAFDVDMEAFKRDNGFAIENQDGPPALVLEVASPSTGRRDYEEKRDGYESFVIPEYWRTDPSGGKWHNAALAGDRLGPDGKYTPIPIERIGEGILRGYSEVLGLHVCWEHNVVRFYDDEVGYLPTYIELEGRIELETARADAAERRERDAKRLAQSERDARLAAERRERKLLRQIKRLQGLDDA